MIPFQLIQITDGTTTCTLNDGTSYLVTDYAPHVPGRKTSVLGGRGPMLDCQEQLEITVIGDSAANAADNLYRLWGLLDQAWRWNRNKRVNPVRLRLQGSACSQRGIVECLALGQSSDDGPMEVSPAYDYAIKKWLISGVQITFNRRGQLLSTSTSGILSVAGAGAPTGTVQSFNWPTVSAQQTADPLVASFTGMAVGGGGDAGLSAAFLIADNPGIDRLQASFQTLGGFTSVNDSAHLAYGNAVLRFTSSGAAQDFSQFAALTNTAYASEIAIYATVRSNTLGVLWNISTLFRKPLFGDTVESTPVPFSPLTTDPVPICLGRVAAQGDATAGIQSFTDMAIKVTTQSAGTLDFDQIYLVATDTNGGNGVVLDYITLASGYTYAITLDPCQLTQPQPRVRVDRTLPTPVVRGTIGYAGNLWNIASSPTMSAVLIATCNSAWVYTNDGTTKANLVTTLTRQLAYATPQ